MQEKKTTTAYREGLKNQILATAMEAFAAQGIRAVKMDDIANALSISKRTLYEVFDNKEELLICGIKLDEERRKEMMTSFVVKNNPGVMDVILKFYHAQMEAISSINPVFFSDISKYDRVRAYLQELHVGRQESALEFFRRGVGEGYFRADVDYVIVSRMSNATINYVMESQMYKEYDLKYIFRNIVLVFLRGFCTLKGQEIIDKKLNEKT